MPGLHVMEIFPRNISFGLMRLVLMIIPISEIKVGQNWAKHVFNKQCSSVVSASLFSLLSHVMG